MNTIKKLPEGRFNHLQIRLMYTLLFLAIYRVGCYIPVSGVNTDALGEFFRGHGANLLGMFNMFSGGAMERFSIFSLGTAPYVSASIIAQILTMVVPHLHALSKEGEAGRRKLNQYTRYGTVALALIQGTMLAISLERAQFSGLQLVVAGGWSWRVMTVLSFAAGTAFVMWLGEQITERGVGNGISLIIFSSIVAGLPRVIGNTYTQVSNQQMDLFRVLVIVALCVVVIAGVVFVEQAARQIPIQYAKRQVGQKIYGGQTSHLPIRINSAGVIPPIFASSFLQFPMTAAGFAPNSFFADLMSRYFGFGDWLYNCVYVGLIISFAFFYVSWTFRADDIAEDLKKNGGFIPGVRPGARTAEFLQRVLDRLTLVGALYLAGICVLPTILIGKFNVQFYFGGTSLLIVVGVALETFRQIEAHRQSLRYEAFLKHSPIRPRGRGL